MSDELLVSVKIPLEDGVIFVEESDCITGLSVAYKEEDYKVELPALSKSQWEKLKRAGDYVFGEIGEIGGD